MSSLAVPRKSALYTCSFCSKTLQSHRGLLIHIHKVHQKDRSCGPNEEKKVCCQEANCSFKCLRLSQLREHLSQCHGFSFTEMVIQFENAGQFHDYLRKFERQNNVEFYINTANLNLKSKVVYYRCNRSGFYRVSKQVVQRRTKNQGSCKIEGHCTAYVKTKEVFETGRVTMQLCNSHYGHDLQLVHLRVPKEDKRIISDSLKRGLDFNEIIDEVRESKPQSAQRTNLIKSKDIYNVMVKEQKKRSLFQPCKNGFSSITRLPKIANVNKQDVISMPSIKSPSPVPKAEDALTPVIESSLECLRKNVLENLQTITDLLTCSSDVDTLTEFLHFSNEWKSRLHPTNIHLVENVVNDAMADDKIIMVSSNDLNFDAVETSTSDEHSNSFFKDVIAKSVIDGTSFSRSLDIKSSHDGENTEYLASNIVPSPAAATQAVLQRPHADVTPVKRAAASLASLSNSTDRSDPVSAPCQAPCEMVNFTVSELPASNCFISNTVCDPPLVYPPSSVQQLVPDENTPAASATGFVLVPSLDPENFVAPQILDRAFTTFSRDGETCFLHVGNELDDKDIQIVIA